MKEIRINKTYNKENNNKILINAIFLVNDNISLKEQSNILDRCMNRLNYGDNLLEVVSFLETIYYPVISKEKLLKITYKQSDNIEKSIKYIDGELSSYTNKINDNYEAIFEYKDKKVNVNFDGSVNYWNVNAERFVYNEFSKITKLEYHKQYCNKKNLFDKERYIVKLYKEMFNSDIDFSDNNISSKLYSLMYILQRHYVYIPISFEKKNGNIYSKELDEIISKLMLFNKIDTSSIYLKKDECNRLKKIGEVLKEHEDMILLIANSYYDNENNNVLDIDNRTKKLINREV